MKTITHQSQKAAQKQRAAFIKEKAKDGKMAKKSEKDFKEIIERYFKEAGEELSKDYNAKTAKEAAEFALILLGLNLISVDDKAIPGMEPKQGKRPCHNEEKTAPASNLGEIPYIDLAQDELKDADKYWNYYEQTGNDMFRQLAKQELGHAAALTETALSVVKTQMEQDSVMELKSKRVMMEKTIK